MRYVDRHRSVSGWTLQSLFCSHASSKIVRIKQRKENESGIFLLYNQISQWWVAKPGLQCCKHILMERVF